MPFEPLNAVELAQRLTRDGWSSKWGDPRYTSRGLNSQELRTLCEAVLDGEQRTAEAIAVFVEKCLDPANDVSRLLVDAIRSGAWKATP